MSTTAAIGLEVHVQLATAAKLLCDCPTTPASAPNSNVCEICLGHPGTLPSLNRRAVELALEVVLALGMTVERELRFDRKHYFYPDLSKNFQISQFTTTLARGGRILLEIEGRPIEVRLREAHLEEDAARLQHTPRATRIDFNRGGIPLLEIVTEPDLRTGREADGFLRHLQLLVRTLGASEANPELGQLRSDVNVSVARPGVPVGTPAPPGTRVELKNLNSPRFVRLAVEHEIKRQSRILETGAGGGAGGGRQGGGTVARETRSWNESLGVTEPLRTKESARDYRYLAEPDLPVVALSPEDLDRIRRGLGELPEARTRRLERDFHLARTAARELVSDPAMADYFEQCAACGADPALAASWTLNQVREIERGRDAPFARPAVEPGRLAALLLLVGEGRVSATGARKILSLLPGSAHSPATLVERERLAQVSDRTAIRGWVEKVLSDEPQAAASYRAGRGRALQFLVGRVLARSRGRANPALVREVLEAALGGAPGAPPPPPPPGPGAQPS